MVKNAVSTVQSLASGSCPKLPISSIFLLLNSSVGYLINWLRDEAIYLPLLPKLPLLAISSIKETTLQSEGTLQTRAISYRLPWSRFQFHTRVCSYMCIIFSMWVLVCVGAYICVLVKWSAGIWYNMCQCDCVNVIYSMWYVMRCNMRCVYVRWLLASYELLWYLSEW